jgi:Ca2+-binding EF-hand superfamily protein
MRQKILNNFNLFDRDNNELINLSELKELLISINQVRKK